MRKVVTILVVLLGIAPLSAFAVRYHTPILETWILEVNNGVAYINSPQMPSHCTYSRAQISMSGTEFDKAQFAYAMAAYKSKTKIKVVVDNASTVCVASGIIDYN